MLLQERGNNNETHALFICFLYFFFHLSSQSARTNVQIYSSGHVYEFLIYFSQLILLHPLVRCKRPCAWACSVAHLSSLPTVPCTEMTNGLVEVSKRLPTSQWPNLTLSFLDVITPTSICQRSTVVAIRNASKNWAKRPLKHMAAIDHHLVLPVQSSLIHFFSLWLNITIMRGEDNAGKKAVTRRRLFSLSSLICVGTRNQCRDSFPTESIVWNSYQR